MSGVPEGSAATRTGKKRDAGWPGWFALAVLVSIALIRTLTAGDRKPKPVLSAADRAAVGSVASAMEPGWRTASSHRFPGDLWSQDDDFHAMERAWVMGEAKRRGVSPREVFRAIDQDLHAHPPLPPRKATASPCKPRSFYD